MKKFEVDIERSVTAVKTFTVYAEDREDAINQAYQQAYDTDWGQGSGEPAYDDIQVEEDTNWDDEDSDGSIDAYESRMDYESDSDDVRNREFGGMDY